MNAKAKILNYLKKQGETDGTPLVRHLGISRQALNKHIQALVREGKVIRQGGATRGVKYRLVSARNKQAPPARHRRYYKLKGLEEHRVFDQFASALRLEPSLSPRSFEIVQFAFTEMLNNAIDHSSSKRCFIEIKTDPYRLHFTVRDWGVGIFHSISSRFGLAAESDAVGELIKGKVTTMADRHSGEGIFFTSKVGDSLSFRSHKLQVVFDNMKEDIFVSSGRSLKGTEVAFTIRRRARKDLAGVFHQYAPAEHDFQFSRTRLMVKLFQKRYVSRSEARRLLAGLEKFREITLDFKGVESIGQGFADEIFRVFKQRHPEIEIRRQNTDGALEAMIRHVVDNKNR